MNKEQIAFEKWAKDSGLPMDCGVINGYDYVSTARAWAAWQARAALDKQDSLEIVKEIERVLSPYDLAAPVTTDWIVLLTKIRKHLTNKE